MTDDDRPLLPIQYTCQICSGVVEQWVGETGLPERTSCPWCAEEVRKATERMRRRDAQARKR